MLGAVRKPAHERLAADRAAAAERQDRLVGEHQLLARKRLQEAFLDLQVGRDLLAQALVEQFRPRATGRLGAIHRHVGLAQHALGIGLRVRRDRHPHARRHRHVRRPHREGLLERRQHAVGEAQRFALALDAFAEDHELVAAEAGDRVAVAHHLPETLGDRDEQLVAYLVAEVVVDRLEAVQVDEEQRDDTLAAVQARERLACAVHQQQPVGQLGERVVQSLLLEPHAVGDVLGRRVPGVAIAARAPQKPAPRAIAMAIAVGEVLQVRRMPAAGEHQGERLLDVVGVDELVHRAGHQLLAAPAERLLPGGVQQREAPVERDRRQ